MENSSVVFILEVRQVTRRVKRPFLPTLAEDPEDEKDENIIASRFSEAFTVLI